MKVAIRTDASLQIGTGHVMRCLTLARSLHEQGAEISFICRHLPESLSALIKEHGHQVMVLAAADHESCVSRPNGTAHAMWLGVEQIQDARDTIAVLGTNAPYDWLIVDHYGLDAQWEKAVRRCAKNILVIDDLADREHDCDVLLDQNYYAAMSDRYTGRVPAGCVLLFGSRYALLRNEFGELRKSVAPRDGAVKRLLVFFGGMDSHNVTSVTLEAILRLGRDAAMDTDVVIGDGHPARDAIRHRCDSMGIRCHVQTPHMAELMAKADLAIGAGGTATWERCALGLPTMVLCLADNQRQLIVDGSRAGLVYAPDIEAHDVDGQLLHLRALLGNAALRNNISRNGLKAVDGLGASRVANHMGFGAIDMRLARLEDSDALLEWRNAPHVRAVSHNTEPIAQDTHVRWLMSVLENPRRKLLIGSRNGEPLGVVRFDLGVDSAEVSIYLASGTHGRGCGSALLLAAERWLQIHHPDITVIRAEVLRDNAPSHRLFSNCRYVVQNTFYTKRIHQ